VVGARCGLRRPTARLRLSVFSPASLVAQCRVPSWRLDLALCSMWGNTVPLWGCSGRSRRVWALPPGVRYVGQHRRRRRCCSPHGSLPQLFMVSAVPGVGMKPPFSGKFAAGVKGRQPPYSLRPTAGFSRKVAWPHWRVPRSLVRRFPNTQSGGVVGRSLQWSPLVGVLSGVGSAFGAPGFAPNGRGLWWCLDSSRCLWTAPHGLEFPVRVAAVPLVSCRVRSVAGDRP